jgi:hypothetical protein
MKPPKLKKGYIANFDTLKRAFAHGDVALVSARRAQDNKPVALVCAMQANEDGTITPVPFAEMVNGNPFKLYHDPTL